MERPLIGADVGGTFTDLVCAEGAGDGKDAGGPRGLRVAKVLSTPRDPSAALLGAIAGLDPARCAAVAHGSTVATNAILERRGARVAFVTTAGFSDLLALGRGERAALYDLRPAGRSNLVAPGDVHVLEERVAADGGIVVALSPAAARRAARAVLRSGAESVAVCTLFAYLLPDHERAFAAAVADELASLPDHTPVPVYLSSEVLPEFREYERASTTVANAYVSPIMARYLDRLESGLDGRRLWVMGSHGGVMSARQAARLGAQTLLSGPAAGVAGALAIASRVRGGQPRIMTFDMGGTSTDVAACEGVAPVVAGTTIGGIPVALPMVGVHTIGAGGGSQAWLDDGGALRVGPRSAGADPGPACYGRGGSEPTVTDAHAVLGRLPDGAPLAGGLRVDRAAAVRSMSDIARRLGAPPERTALEILRVVESGMERALRSVSLEQGHDPRSFDLVAFGGAGPLHACPLAEQLGARAVIIPALPGALSALGLILAEPGVEVSRTVLRKSGSLADLEDEFGALERRATRRLDSSVEVRAREGVRLERWVDARYAGQSWELRVRWPDGAGAAPAVVRDAFEAEHVRHYGHARPDLPIELVTLRVRASLPALHPPDARADFGRPEPSRQVAVVGDDGDERLVPAVHRSELNEGTDLYGPALILQRDCTVWVAAGWRVRVTTRLDLLLDRLDP